MFPLQKGFSLAGPARCFSGCWNLSCNGDNSTFTFVHVVSYFTPFRLRKALALLWHNDAEDWEIYNHVPLLWFPELCRMFFPVNSTLETFWNVRIYYLLPRKIHYRLTRVEPKTKSFSTNGHWARAGELDLLGVCFWAFPSFLFLLRKLVECTWFSELGCVVKPSEVQERQSL